MRLNITLLKLKCSVGGLDGFRLYVGPHVMGHFFSFFCFKSNAPCVSGVRGVGVPSDKCIIGKSCFDSVEIALQLGPSSSTKRQYLNELKCSIVK